MPLVPAARELSPFNVIDRDTTSLLGFKGRYEIDEWTLVGRGDSWS